MNKKHIVLAIVAFLIFAVIAVVLMLFWNKPVVLEPVSPIPVTDPTSNEEPALPIEEYVPKDGNIQPVLPIEQQADFIIDVTSAGFSPETLKIKRGQSVIWTNRDKYSSHGIISTGNVYPESGDCGSKMNTCSSISLGQSFRVTFDRVGTWEYQDTERAQFTGTIIVE